MALAPPRARVAQSLAAYEYIAAPVGGWNPDAPPVAMPAGQAPILDNFLPRQGHIRVRPPMALHSRDWNNSNTSPAIWGHAVSSNPAAFPGIGGFTRYLLTSANPAVVPRLNMGQALWVKPTAASAVMGAVSTTDITTGSFWVLNTSGPASRIPFFQPYPTTGWLDPAGGFTGTLFPNQTGPVHGYTNFGPLLFFINQTTGQSLSTFYNGFSSQLPSTGIIMANTVAPSFFSVVAGFPLGVIEPTAIKVYQQRLWQLGGATVSNAPLTIGQAVGYSPNNLFFSIPMNPLTASNSVNPELVSAGLDTFWVNPITLTTQQLFVGAEFSDPGMALSVFNQRLIIFNFKSVYIMTGTDPSNYNPQLLSREVGTIDQRSVIETDHGVYFMSHRGVYVTTGSSVTPVSGNVTRTLSLAIQRFISTSLQGFSAQCTGALLSDGSLLWTIRISDGATAGQYNTIFSGLYNPATNSWTRLTSNLFAGSDAIAGGSTSDFTYDADPSYLVNDPFHSETASIGNHAGVTIEAPSEGINYSSDNAGDVIAGFVYDFDNDLVSVQTYVVPARWVTGFIPLSGGGRTNSSLVRVSADYALQVQNGFAPNASMILRVYDTHFQVIDGDTTLPSISQDVSTAIPGATGRGLGAVNPYTLPTIQRTTKDMGAAEVDHVQIAIINGTSAAHVMQAQIYGIGVEFQQGRNLR